MLFENTIKQLGWYFKGQITAWGVWIVEYRASTKTVDNKVYKVRIKDIQIPDSKANIRKYVADTKRFYAEMNLESWGYQSRTDWRYKTSYTSDLWDAEGANYGCLIVIDLSKLGYLTLEDLKAKALDAKSYIQKVDIQSFPNGARVVSLRGFEVDNCLSVDLTNSGSVNKGVNNIDIFPYCFESKYINDSDGSHFIKEERLVDSDCNKYVRRILMNEVALFINEIIKYQS